MIYLLVSANITAIYFMSINRFLLHREHRNYLRNNNNNNWEKAHEKYINLTSNCIRATINWWNVCCATTVTFVCVHICCSTRNCTSIFIPFIILYYLLVNFVLLQVSTYLLYCFQCEYTQLLCTENFIFVSINHQTFYFFPFCCSVYV